MQNSKKMGEDKLKEATKKYRLDMVVTAIVAIALVICFFFWGCQYDLPVTILAGVVLLGGVGLCSIQYKKLKELYEVPKQQASR